MKMLRTANTVSVNEYLAAREVERLRSLQRSVQGALSIKLLSTAAQHTKNLGPTLYMCIVHRIVVDYKAYDNRSDLDHKSSLR